MGLTDIDLIPLENALLKNPRLGDVIEGTGGARKIRIRLKSGREKAAAAESSILIYWKKVKFTFFSPIQRINR